MSPPSAESAGESTLRGLWEELRPHQWYKQVILFIPLVYSGQAVVVTDWGRIMAGALVFSFVAGCVYIVNDILDREADREHPVKRHRPIASGLISVRIALTVAVAGLLAAGIVALWLDPFFLAVVSIYVAQNLAYSIFLKHILLVDIFLVGAGFVLRALAGVALIEAPLSPWLFLSVFLAAFLLASAKRYAEFVNASESATRASLDSFTPDFSLFLLFLASSTLLVVYSLYTFFARRTEMMVTIPFAYYSVLRFTNLLIIDPTEQINEILFHRDMVLNFILWGVVTIIVLYPFPFK